MKNVRLFVLIAITSVLGGCAFIPLQERTLTNASGGVTTCKQVGAGLFSYFLGKWKFDSCVAKAQADGYR